MASMYYDRKGRRWRVCWHVTLTGGVVGTEEEIISYLR
jgi:hypothetical protein